MQMKEPSLLAHRRFQEVDAQDAASFEANYLIKAIHINLTSFICF